VSVTVPIVALPSRKEILPVGVPDPGATGLTVAVNVTVCPNTDGFKEETTDVVVDACETWLNLPGDVLLAKLLSPPYTAVSV
jgi:hypothetical protein